MSGLLERLSNDLVLPSRDLIYLIQSAPHRYKVYNIPKKTPGKTREIAQPAREVKPLQRWLMSNVLNNFLIHPAAVAYRNGRSIRHNAVPHAPHRYLCKLDFTNFFPSIKSIDFENYMRQNSHTGTWTEQEIGYMSRILFWQRDRKALPQLSIGAPSSPLLSNILLYGFDLRITALCNQHDVTYTRYADDLCFSTNESGVLRQLEGEVAQICREIRSPRLFLNSMKTVHASKKGSRRVTGLILTNDGQVSIGRSKKREIRAWFHKYIRGLLSEEEIAELRGMLSFVNSVEPVFLQRIAKTYGTAALNNLLSTGRPLGPIES